MANDIKVICRSDAINALVADVENWDLNNLIGYVQDSIGNKLAKCTLEELASECDTCLGDTVTHEVRWDGNLNPISLSGQSPYVNVIKGE